MGDADIIPIGTRGRPGRGGGGRRPSASSRDLAGPRAGGREATGDADEPGTPAGPDSADVPGAAGRPGTAPTAPTAPAGATGAETPDAGTSGERPPQPAEEHPTRPAATTRDRGPLAGVPVGDWLQAFQTAATELFGEDAERQLARFLAFLRRRVTGDYEVDEFGFDAELTERFLIAALRPIAEKWFRVEVRGIENVPAEGGALVVSNHSGTVPVDGLMTLVAVHDHAGRFLRPLGADLVFRLPIVSSMARKSGTTLACNADAERLLRGGELVGVWPEGFKGIGKPFSERYKLQRFGRGGFVAAAIRTGVPIVPLSVVGAEEIYPLVGNVPSLARLLGLPYLPITPTFPLLGPLGLVPLPSKWVMEFGEPVRTDELDAGAADDPMLVFDVTDQVRETIQSSLYRLLIDRGGAFG
ncbi:lysophospholipid acyltransferase family protein [Nocardioides zeae]|uniref:Lysophospholipid acyltransferase family protein n=1 Tax=Nocardioides imazamoxiresistens TaxID=3231893 RepID=A0ABU3Q020_9ACTN|nr:lysophospholipid acyltransferase family protein [Nocardioides zeae]MDT9594796.1 lysophospholipid acyltransferase family protein [Nocardioides zeae]